MTIFPFKSRQRKELIKPHLPKIHGMCFWNEMSAGLFCQELVWGTEKIKKVRLFIKSRVLKQKHTNTLLVTAVPPICGDDFFLKHQG